jgi:hypothetical protein
MAATASPQEWIDRYVREVGRLLPPRKQADVEMEIRSLIEDGLESRTAAGGARDEAAVFAVLKEFGRPRQMAARYGAPQVLIGPALYPIFLTVLRVVLGVVAAVALFGVAVGIGISGGRPPILETVADFFGTLLQAGAMIVLIFALIERANRSEFERELEKPWDPRTLPAIEETERVKVGETLVGIGFSIAALVFFNFYLDSVGVYRLPGGEWQRFPIFSEPFRSYVPWLTLWWGATLMLSIVVLVRGHWQAWSRLAQIAVDLFGVGILFSMLTGGPLAVWAPLEPAFKVTIAIILVVTVVDVVKRLYALVIRSGRTSPPQHASV